MIPGFDKHIEAIRDKPCRDNAEKRLAERLFGKRAERAVQPSYLFGIMIDRGPYQEIPYDVKDYASRGETYLADSIRPSLFCAAHLLDFDSFAKFILEAFVDLV